MLSSVYDSKWISSSSGVAYIAVLACSFEQSNPPSNPQKIVHGSTARERKHRADWQLSQPHLINCKMLSGAAGVLAGNSVGVQVLLMAYLFHPCMVGLADWHHQHVSRCNIASGISVHLVETIHSLGVYTSTLVRKQYWLVPFSLSTS